MTAPPRESHARVRGLVALYRQTRYEVTLPDANVATLRVGEPVPPAVTRLIGAARFAVYLTACNPYSASLTVAHNQSRFVRLCERLCALGARWLEGIASSAEKTWSEPSVLVSGVPTAVCDALAFEFEQNASVGVDASGRARLRVYRHDWRAALDAASDIDWIER